MEPKELQVLKEAPTTLSKVGIFLIGIYLIVLAIFLIYLFVAFWPTEFAGTSSPQTTNIVESGTVHSEAIETSSESQPKNQNKEKMPWAKVIGSLGAKTNIPHEVRIILLVIIAGALGSFVHVVTSFVDYVGAKKFKGSWTWWYFLRPFSGSVLALIFYLIIRGGLLSTQIEGTDLSHFGVTGMAGLVGLFSKQAINKLSEMFNLMFKLAKEKSLPDSLEDEGNQDTTRVKP